MECCVSVRLKEVCKDYMERMMKEDIDWNYDGEGDAVEGAVV